MTRNLNSAELNVALLRALGVNPAGVTAAVLTLRPRHPPRVVVTRMLTGEAGVVQQVESLKLQAVAVGVSGEGMVPVSTPGTLASMSTGEGR